VRNRHADLNDDAILNWRSESRKAEQGDQCSAGRTRHAEASCRTGRDPLIGTPKAFGATIVAESENRKK
jgi:hypothetical protein